MEEAQASVVHPRLAGRFTTTNGHHDTCVAAHGTWLAQWAPLQVLIVTSLFATVAFVINIYFVSQPAYLGVTLSEKTDSQHLMVANVAPTQSSALMVGDIVVAFKDAAGKVVKLTPEVLIKSPADTASTFEQYNRLLAMQGQIYDMYSMGAINVELMDGSDVTLTPIAYTPLSELSFRYWLINLLGTLVLLVGVGVWGFRRGEPATRLLALSGVGFWLAAFFGSMYLFREFAMPLTWLRLADVGNSVGGLLLAGSILGLLWYYPRQLGALRIAVWIYFVVVALLSNEYFQLIDLPLHSFSIQYLITFILGIGFSFLQWKKSHRNPVARAALRWFLLSVMVSTGLIVALYFLPLVLNSHPLVSPAITYYILLILYAGLMLGVLRFQLFRLEGWWFKVWVYYLFGVFVLLLDILLAYVLNVRFLESLSLAVLIVLWFYFPLRQWGWEHFIVAPRKRLEQYLPKFIVTICSAVSPEQLDGKWLAFLTAMFESLNAKCISSPSEQSSLADNGLTLCVPAVSTGKTIVLTGRNQSTRLFAPQDKQTADALLSIARELTKVKQAHEQGVIEERERIKRDLHDDVGAKLLTLMHRSPTQADEEIARSALRSLRDTIYSLEQCQRLTLEEVLADVRSEAQERLEAAGIEMQWRQSGQDGSQRLGHLVSINLARIVREVLSNIIVHAYASRVVVQVEITQAMLGLVIKDNGISPDVTKWELGIGVQNITRRATEISAGVNWGNSISDTDVPKGVSFKLIMPIKQE